MKTLKTSLIDFEVAYQHGIKVSKDISDKTGLWRSAWKNIENGTNKRRVGKDFAIYLSEIICRLTSHSS